MASIILTQAGGVIGSAYGGLLGAMAGRIVGSIAGNYIDNNLFPSQKYQTFSSRLENLLIQTSCYGRIIPQIYGSAVIAGNIIWSAPLEEKISNSRKNHNHIHTEYNYSISCAIALCNGPIDSISRIWINNQLVDINFARYRLYKGSEDQSPDHLIESYEGIGKTPAYRGLAYIVIEDFNLSCYGNRVPNFLFEVKKKFHDKDNSVEDMINNMVIIPGCGEFVYDPIIQYKVFGLPTPTGGWIERGPKVRINHNTHFDKADSIVSLDQLQETCSNLKYISVVVGWFTNNLDIKYASVFPGVEYHNHAITEPDLWKVKGLSRNEAYLLSKDKNDLPNYGGTINDESLVRYLKEIKARNLKVMLIPMMLVDLADKPWRGRITGNAEDVVDFFNKEDGYNNFITHYAKLTKEFVDSFAIGSEMIGITKIKDKNNNFLSVKELVKLAKKVREIFGKDTKITYAADWSEYHHTEQGWYHMDELWASDDIDVVGIDAYFPITRENGREITEQEIIDGFEKGENYDFYYENNNKIALSKEYALKNIKWWWENIHINPDGNKTKWKAKSKKIWFTEFGFPSVDLCTNQPNVFYNPDSRETGFPVYSEGKIDFQAQKKAIMAFIKKWRDSELVEEMFLWCWDARPYPFFPGLKRVWSDYNLWAYGHWVNGKLCGSSLSTIVKDICCKVGLKEDQIDCSLLFGDVEGYVLAENYSARKAIEILSKAFLFNVIESEGKLKFIPFKNGQTDVLIDEDEFIIHHSKPLYQITQNSEKDLPRKIELSFLDRANEYKCNYQNSAFEQTNSKEVFEISLPLVLDVKSAKKIADNLLHYNWQKRLNYSFILGPKYCYLEPGDIISLKISDIYSKVKINSICHGSSNVLEVNASSCDFKLELNTDEYILPNAESIIRNDVIAFEILELGISNNPEIFIAAATILKKHDLYIFNNHKNIYQLYGTINTDASIGVCIGELNHTEEIDNESVIEVVLLNGELSSIEEFKDDLNIAMIGNEIVQFLNAELIGENHYKVYGFKRGLYKSKKFITEHKVNERFILIDDNIVSIQTKVNQEINYKLGDRLKKYTYPSLY